MELIDTHCHLDVAEFDPDRDQVLAAARAAGVGAIVVPGILHDTLEALLAYCATDAALHPALGLHPVYLEHHLPHHLTALERLIADHRPVAVGEIGLDFFVRGLDRAAQLRLLDAQLAIARDAGLPVLLHCRKAHEELLAALRRTPVPGGIAHAFNGSPEQARRYIDLGFKLGIGGTVTFANARRIHQLARQLPLEALVLETDAPDIPPHTHRYERNSPAYLPDILHALATLRDEAPEAIAAITTRTARALLMPARER